ncbi:DNA-directed RNA polymerase subunit alpha C-terminal domain-containing protein (plasmid) [Nocardia sp. PE-7]|uniref:DNA-directed RNA polymerase subunit alpha C-terminal domain-containing protein n=1 Tax=Nocardia sp. PE-7 TaxID=3058426 RepID=UPI0026588FE0|nr:DNA-directed RNA polymerase subunit alpha C-terminal domain-containing protein [Nocardia sp. PE-7]WKG13597.1 DNA-directed RNA polymerase subunit alpha C-terminal domain-containing protein [Nocardia sp. PE-7]
MSEATAPKELATIQLRTMFSPRLSNMLGREGIFTLSDLMTYTHHDLDLLPSFGVGTLATIDAALAEHGLRLDRHEPHQPTLLEEFATVLEQRDQLLALIERITDAVGTVEGLHDIDTTLGGMDTKPTVRQASTTYHRNNRR